MLIFKANFKSYIELFARPEILTFLASKNGTMKGRKNCNQNL